MAPEFACTLLVLGTQFSPPSPAPSLQRRARHYLNPDCCRGAGVGAGGLSQQKAAGVSYPWRAHQALLSPAVWDQRELQRIPAVPSVFSLGGTSSHHQGSSLCSPCPRAQLQGPHQAGGNCRDVQGNSGCSALEHLLPLWEPWAPAEEGIDGVGRERTAPSA